jgi:hypothetical protein
MCKRRQRKKEAMKKEIIPEKDRGQFYKHFYVIL